MKKYILICLLGIFCLSIAAQSDASLVSISAVQPDYENIPKEARDKLETTMQRLITACGIANSTTDRFIMTARMDVLTLYFKVSRETSLVAKMLSSQGRGPRFHAWSEN